MFHCRLLLALALQLLTLLLLGELHLMLQHLNLLAQLLGQVLRVHGLDLRLDFLGHVVDAEAPVVELSASLGLVQLLHVLEGAGDGLGNWGRGGNVLALGHESTVVGGVVHAVELAVIASVLIQALGVGSAGVVELSLFLAVDAVLSQEAIFEK